MSKHLEIIAAHEAAELRRKKSLGLLDHKTTRVEGQLSGPNDWGYKYDPSRNPRDVPR